MLDQSQGIQKAWEEKEKYRRVRLEKEADKGIEDEKEEKKLTGGNPSGGEESPGKHGGRLEDSLEEAAHAAQPILFVILKTRCCSELSISTEDSRSQRQSPGRQLG